MSSWELSLPPERPQRLKGKFTKGHNPWHKGKRIGSKHSVEARTISNANLMKGSEKGHIPWNVGRGRKVLMFENGIEIGCFDTAGVCQKKTGINRRYIYNVLEGKQRHAKGYTFKYLENYEEKRRRESSIE